MRSGRCRRAAQRASRISSNASMAAQWRPRRPPLVCGSLAAKIGRVQEQESRNREIRIQKRERAGGRGEDQPEPAVVVDVVGLGAAAVGVALAAQQPPQIVRVGAAVGGVFVAVADEDARSGNVGPWEGSSSLWSARVRHAPTAWSMRAASGRPPDVSTNEEGGGLYGPPVSDGLACGRQRFKQTWHARRAIQLSTIAPVRAGGLGGRGASPQGTRPSRRGCSRRLGDRLMP
jgi:hypothetical protein